MTVIRVAIADDHQLFCSGIQMLIESQPDLEFVGAAYDGEAAVALARGVRPDVMLMDIRMPTLDGIEATARIVETFDEVNTAATPDDNIASPHAYPKIIMLTTFQRDAAVVRAIQAGADGFLLAARGLSNAEIAQTAFIGETTVKSHIRSILAKLSLNSRVQVVAHAYENGLLR